MFTKEPFFNKEINVVFVSNEKHKEPDLKIYFLDLI